MMNLSLITTALPSLGRLLMDMKPRFQTFPVDIGNRPADSLPKNSGYGTGTGRRSMLADWPMPRNQVQVQVTSHNDGDSTEGLVREDTPPNGIKQTTFFEVTESRH